MMGYRKRLCSAMQLVILKGKVYQICRMYFKATFRHNPATGKSDWYYRLVESHRNVLDEIRQHTILSVGFMNEFTGEQIDQIRGVSIAGYWVSKVFLKMSKYPPT